MEQYTNQNKMFPHIHDRHFALLKLEEKIFYERERENEREREKAIAIIPQKRKKRFSCKKRTESYFRL